MPELFRNEYGPTSDLRETSAYDELECARIRLGEAVESRDESQVGERLALCADSLTRVVGIIGDALGTLERRLEVLEAVHRD